MRFGELSPVSLSNRPITFKEYIDIYDEASDRIANGESGLVFGDASASTLTDDQVGKNFRVRKRKENILTILGSN